MIRAFVIVVLSLINSVWAEDKSQKVVESYFRQVDWYRFVKSYDGILHYKGEVEPKLLLKSCRGKDVYMIDTGEIYFDFKEYDSDRTVDKGWLKGGYVGGQIGNPILLYEVDEDRAVSYKGTTYLSSQALEWQSKKGCRFLKYLKTHQ